MGEPEAELKIDGRSLTIDEVVAVARDRRRVSITHDALVGVARCRALVDVLLDVNEKVYGLTTGFGILRDIAISREDVGQLQENLIRSHAAGVGKPFAEDVVRAAILLRANTLCRGNSGVRTVLVEQLVAMLNDHIYPYVPSKGSVGASGDLAPLSHLALVLMGDPDGKYFPNKRRSGEFISDCTEREFVPMPKAGDQAALARTSKEENWRAFKPIKLEAKEGLALNNGTQFMTAMACLSLWDASLVLKHAELGAAISLEANRGIRRAYSPSIHEARPQEYQSDSAQRVIDYCDGSQIIDFYLNTGYLRRAEYALKRARTSLQKKSGGRTAEQNAGPASHAAGDRLGALVGALQNLVPRNEHGFAEPRWVDQHCRLPAQTQIEELRGPVEAVQRDAEAFLTEVGNASDLDADDRAEVKKALRVALKELEKVLPDSPYTQDDYSLRCFPQVVAGAWRALHHVKRIVEVEINSATDNPLLFPFSPDGGFESLGVHGAADPDKHHRAYVDWITADTKRVERCKDSVIGGGNFHGQPIATAMDYLAIGMAEVASISERRIAHLVDENHSRGLPQFLIENGGLNSGFMIPQYTAAALVSENKTLCHPASVDSIPTCANSEDHVSMGTFAARKCATVIEHVRWVVAIEIFAGYQALQFREPLQPGHRIRKAFAHLEAAGVRRFDADRVMHADICRMEELLRSDRLLEAAK